MSSPIGCSLGDTEFKVARYPPLAWDALSVVTTGTVWGWGRDVFYLTFTMNSFQIKDLRKRVMLTQKIWLDAMNFPVKSLNSNQRPGLFYSTSESWGNADSPRHTSEVAKKSL